MIADLAVIVSVYAIARLLNEYVFVGEQWKALRMVAGLIATGIVALFLASVVVSATDLSSL